MIQPCKRYVVITCHLRLIDKYINIGLPLGGRFHQNFEVAYQSLNHQYIPYVNFSSTSNEKVLRNLMKKIYDLQLIVSLTI